jgi:hypothetical protein
MRVTMKIEEREFERAWLVESTVNEYDDQGKPCGTFVVYAGAIDNGQNIDIHKLGWTKDAYAAIRFSRKEDATRMCYLLRSYKDLPFWNGTPVEHAFEQ